MIEALDKSLQLSLQNDNIQLLCDCLTKVTIHNYSGSGIKDEFTLLPFFRSVLSLPDD